MRYFCQKYQHISTMNKGQRMGYDAGLTLMGMNEKLENKIDQLNDKIVSQDVEIDNLKYELEKYKELYEETETEKDDQYENLSQTINEQQKEIKILDKSIKLHNDLIDLLRKEKQELYNRARRAEAIAEDERFRICPICRKDNGYKKLENMLKDR